VLRARLWRLYTLCWACEQALHVDGAIVDIGTYDGRALEVVLRYQREQREVYAYDYFDGPPAESKKSEHGPNLQQQVVERLGEWEASIFGGDIRHHADTLPDQIAFCQIDLNDAEAEGFVFPLVYERLSPGGIVIFDDYGFARYHESAVTHQKFLEGKEQILEMPTGQGLLIKA
jgi:hypothetical protein